MPSFEITKGVYSVGAVNPNLRVFDIVMKTEYGTTYNAYLVKGTEKTALIETCHARFFDIFVENIGEVCDLAQIDYIILNHNEPDHSGALARLVDLCPKAQVVASQAGSIYLKNITNRSDLKVTVVKDGEKLNLGGKTLTFLSAPFLHWPDSIFTWLEEDKILFSCDFLGAHYCEPYVLDTRVNHPEAYEAAFLGYYEAIFGPFKPYVLKGLEKIQDLDLEFVCPSHGPVLTRDCRIPYVKEMYAKWSQPVKNETPLIPVFYVTAYGNTGLVAEAIAKGIRSVLPQAQVETYDVIHHDFAKLQGLLAASDAFAVGSPTLNRDALPPIWDLLTHIDAVNCQKKPVLAFGSYGWSGEAVPYLVDRLGKLKMKVFGEGYKVCFVPSQKDLAEAEELGPQFARSL